MNALKLLALGIGSSIGAAIADYDRKNLAEYNQGLPDDQKLTRPPGAGRPWDRVDSDLYTSPGMARCWNCEGTGESPFAELAGIFDQPCGRCRGTGNEPTFRTIPYHRLTRFQRLRESIFEGTYMRDEHGNTYYNRSISRA